MVGWAFKISYLSIYPIGNPGYFPWGKPAMNKVAPPHQLNPIEKRRERVKQVYLLWVLLCVNSLSPQCAYSRTCPPLMHFRKTESLTAPIVNRLLSSFDLSYNNYFSTQYISVWSAWVCVWLSPTELGFELKAELWMQCWDCFVSLLNV